jgi:hypothetical protein
MNFPRFSSFCRAGAPTGIAPRLPNSGAVSESRYRLTHHIARGSLFRFTRWLSLAAAILSTLLAVLLQTAALAQQPQVFYAIGSEEQSPGDNLYEVDAATLRVVRWVDASQIKSGMLTAKRDAIVMGGGDRMLRVTAPGLVIQSEMTIGPHRGVMCLDDVYVHPDTGLADFTCSFGSDSGGVLVVDTLKKTVVADLYPASPEQQGNAIPKSLAKIFGSGDRVIQDWDVKRDLKQVVPLPNGNLVLETYDTYSRRNPPRLLLCDAVTGKVLRTWTETQKYPEIETYIDSHTGKEMERSVQKIAVLHAGPVPSRDGSRLFAMSEDDVILWDSSTLEELDRFDAPGGTDGSFVTAPDGRGMWFLGGSGKIYRLDDHTGHLIEEVKLPFRLINLIREP